MHPFLFAALLLATAGTHHELVGFEPAALAAADFDEDGVPDLVATYTAPDRGVVVVHRGNVAAIYPHLGSRAGSFFHDAPRSFDVRLAPDFLGAGDFDGDGHRDLVIAQRGTQALTSWRETAGAASAIRHASSSPDVSRPCSPERSAGATQA